MVFLGPYSASISLLEPLPYSSFSDTYCNPPHIFLHLSSLPVTNNSLLPALLFSTFLHVQLLVHHDTARLSLPLILHPLAYTLYLSEWKTGDFNYFHFLSYFFFFFFFYCGSTVLSLELRVRVSHMLHGRA